MPAVSPTKAQMFERATQFPRRPARVGDVDRCPENAPRTSVGMALQPGRAPSGRARAIGLDDTEN